MSTFTMSAETWNNTSEYAERAIVPEAIGQLIEITGVDQFQGKKDPSKEYVVIRLVTDIEDRQYKFEQFFTVVENDEPAPQGQEMLSRFIKNVNRYDIVDQDGDAVNVDFDALAETTFIADIKHGGNNPDKPFINLYSIVPEAHPRSDEEPPPEKAVEEEAKAEAPEEAPEEEPEEKPAAKASPSKPGRMRKPGARR